MIEQGSTGSSRSGMRLGRSALRGGVVSSKLPIENTLQAYPTARCREAQTGGLMLWWDWVGASRWTVGDGRDWRRWGRRGAMRRGCSVGRTGYVSDGMRTLTEKDGGRDVRGVHS